MTPPLPPLTDSDQLAAILGGPALDGADGSVAAWAVDVVSAMARSYCRLTVTPVDGAVLVLTGTRSSRLVVGERPLRSVLSVSTGDDTLAPDEYVALRSGVLVRAAGWGGPETEWTVTADVGFEVVPADLRAVVETAAARLSQFGAREDDDQPPRPFGWTVAERLVLDRYRRRTG